MSNSKAAIQSSSKLEPLVSVRTGEIIEGFPATPGRISALEGMLIHTSTAKFPLVWY